MASLGGQSQQEGYVNAISSIISQLIKAYENRVPINLSKMKSEISNGELQSSNLIYYHI